MNAFCQIRSGAAEAPSAAHAPGRPAALPTLNGGDLAPGPAQVRPGDCLTGHDCILVTALQDTTVHLIVWPCCTRCVALEPLETGKVRTILEATREQIDVFFGVPRGGGLFLMSEEPL